MSLIEEIMGFGLVDVLGVLIKSMKRLLLKVKFRRGRVGFEDVFRTGFM
jgi:hypothetical protein